MEQGVHTWIQGAALQSARTTLGLGMQCCGARGPHSDLGAAVQTARTTLGLGMQCCGAQGTLRPGVRSVGSTLGPVNAEHGMYTLTQGVTVQA